MQKEYGFVYIWRDKKHKRFYIGCHWGNEDDGYVCSSVWMKNSQKRRPNDFRRKILKRIYSNKKDLFESESYYLSKIKKEELGKKYYNLKNNIEHWSANLEKSSEVKERIKQTQKGRPGKKHTEEVKKTISSKLMGRKLSDGTKSKLSEINKGNAFFSGKKHSEESKQKMSDSHKGNKYFFGKKHSEESKQKMSNAAKKRNKKEMPKSKCNYCGKEGGINALKRYHFDNCINRT